MLNRRLIRIKVFKILYGFVFSGEDSLKQAEQHLLKSCEDTLFLYNFIKILPIALKRYADNKIETGLKKFHPTPEEVTPNLKFSQNKYIAKLLNDSVFNAFCEKNGLVWGGDLMIFVKKLYTTMSEKEYFKEYMQSPERTFSEDCEFIQRMYVEELIDNEELEALLEDMSLYWMDDLEYIVNLLLRDMDLLKNKSMTINPSVFMKEDDKEFAVSLLQHSIIHYNEYMDAITANVSNWDSDRIVATDLILIEQGISEAVKFPNIPIKATINEYVEISKFYSTMKSRVFVNGLLDKMIQKMVASGEIVKTGRGLIES